MLDLGTLGGSTAGARNQRCRTGGRYALTGATRPAAFVWQAGRMQIWATWAAVPATPRHHDTARWWALEQRYSGARFSWQGGSMRDLARGRTHQPRAGHHGAGSGGYARTDARARAFLHGGPRHIDLTACGGGQRRHHHRRPRHQRSGPIPPTPPRRPETGGALTPSGSINWQAAATASLQPRAHWERVSGPAAARCGVTTQGRARFTSRRCGRQELQVAPRGRRRAAPPGLQKRRQLLRRRRHGPGHRTRAVTAPSVATSTTWVRVAGQTERKQAFSNAGWWPARRPQRR